jgi:hypothetical protein
MVKFLSDYIRLQEHYQHLVSVVKDLIEEIDDVSTTDDNVLLLSEIVRMVIEDGAVLSEKRQPYQEHQVCLDDWCDEEY